MIDFNELKKFSEKELNDELMARKTRSSRNNIDLKSIDSETIINVLRNRQKAIYGSMDIREDFYQIHDQTILNDLDSVVALFFNDDVIDKGNGISTLVTGNFGHAYILCPGEHFRNQPIDAFSSGFLVAPEIIATTAFTIFRPILGQS
jgi:hypothetical protein